MTLSVLIIHLRWKAEEKLIKQQHEFERYCLQMYRDVEKNVSEIKREYSHFYQYLDDLEAQRNVLAELDEKINTIRQQLIEAQQEQKILAKLKDKYHDDFISCQQKEEQHILDELSIIGINNSLSN